MRLVTMLVALSAGAMLPHVAAAQDAPKKQAAPARKAPPRVSPIAAVYGAMLAADKIAIQSDLIWTGDFNGVPSADFGPRTIAAVKAFQARNGGAQTGILTPEERAALAASAKAKQDAIDWRVLNDPATAARLGIPLKITPTSAGTKEGTRWSSARGEVQVETFRVAEPETKLASVLGRQRKQPAGRQITYSVLRPDFFVLSGTQGLKKFYVRAQVRGEEVRGLTILYDQAMEGIMNHVVIAMSGAYQAFPTGALAGPPPKRKIDYGTGVVVSAAGYLLTDRQITEGCYVVTIPSLGGADIVAEDKANDLALLRVYGARNLVPLALGDAPSGEVTLVGVPDPQGQGGGSVTTSVKARVSDNRGLDPAPVLGFSGAAALDAQGRLAGMVQLKPAVVAGPSSAAARAQLVPGETLAAFLAAQKIEAAPSASAPETAKSSVVRVICARQ
jgi:peptidoglycan hydrolase-like protein with peptidoglycan-binding domain